MLYSSGMDGKLIVLTGISGAGKDTIMSMMLESVPELKKIVTHTTRPARPGEKHGFDYHFVSESFFEGLITNNRLIEYVKYGSHYKGTLKDEFEKVLTGATLIWRIDISRAAKVTELFYEKFDTKTAEILVAKTKTILIKPPSVTTSFKRFIAREKEKADVEEFEKRLNQDMEIFKKHEKNFPHVIVNRQNKQNEALQQILKLVN